MLSAMAGAAPPWRELATWNWFAVYRCGVAGAGLVLAITLIEFWIAESECSG